MFRLLGIILLAAGLLKGRELTLLGASGSSFWEAQWFAVAVVAGEIVLGCWLLSGLWPRTSWWLSVLCFIAFLGVSLDRALAGAASCGCFGSVQIPPWYMVGFDGIALVLLWATQPMPRLAPEPKWRFGPRLWEARRCDKRTNGGPPKPRPALHESPKHSSNVEPKSVRLPTFFSVRGRVVANVAFRSAKERSFAERKATICPTTQGVPR